MAEQIYQRLKQEIFDYQLLPHDRFSETELAARYQVSRTPVRDALYRLEREGYLEVGFRRGWTVKPLDFDQIDELYDLRVVLESVAIERLCGLPDLAGALADLNRVWMVPPERREHGMKQVADLDEAFHCGLLAAAGNREMMRVHAEVCDRIRIVRRLDFYKSARIEETYNEHARILTALAARKRDEAQMMLRSHIEQSKIEVRKISLSMLAEARHSLRQA
nr:GntR family transcriptional regulator [Pseudomonas oleovorans]